MRGLILSPPAAEERTLSGYRLMVGRLMVDTEPTKSHRNDFFWSCTQASFHLLLTIVPKGLGSLGYNRKQLLLSLLSLSIQIALSHVSLVNISGRSHTIQSLSGIHELFPCWSIKKPNPIYIYNCFASNRKLFPLSQLRPDPSSERCQRLPFIIALSLAFH